MEKKIRNVGDINLLYLCHGCGACYSICPVNAIYMERNKFGWHPAVDDNRCKYCRVCLNVCPGISINLNEYSRTIFKNENKENSLIGQYINTYIGYSNDDKLRWEATSGGIITSILIYMLEKNIIDGAIVTKMDENNPLIPKSLLARSKEEIINAKTSKYSPTSVNVVVKEIKNSDGGFAVVGLPCQIHGIRKLQKQDKELKKKIKITIGLFCSHTVTFTGTEILLKKFFKEKKENIASVKYRGNGWPGDFVAKNRENIYKIKLKDYWSSLFGPYFFTPPRCITCNDLSNELADISVGDAWLREIMRNDKKGASIFVVRSKIGKEIIHNMVEDGYISVKEITPAKVIESQKGILYRKKIGINGRIALLNFLGKPIPDLGENVKYSNVSMSSYIGALMVLFNIFLSSRILGQKFLVKIPKRLLQRYGGFTYKFSQKR